MVTTNSVMQLHQRLKSNDDTSASGTRNKEMLRELENAVMMTQTMLTKITTNRYIFRMRFYYRKSSRIRSYNYFNFSLF